MEQVYNKGTPHRETELNGRGRAWILRGARPESI
jgi:hypothetical protein